MYVRRRSTKPAVRKSTTVRRTTRSNYKKKSPATYQARLNYSKRRYNANKSIANQLSLFSETKYKIMNGINEQLPVPIQSGALAHMAKFVVGGGPTGWTDLTDLGGMSFTQGSATSNRIGDYIYLKKSHLNIEIDTKISSDSNNHPTEFRMIVAKARRNASPAGTNRTPQSTLFLDEIANDFGDGTGGKNGTDLMVQPLNKRHWMILKDYKFKMSNPLDPTATTNSYTGMYPTMKRFSVNLPHYIKAHFDDSNQPTNYDFHYLVIIYARSQDKDTKADNWEVNIRGNTQYVDN